MVGGILSRLLLLKNFSTASIAIFLYLNAWLINLVYCYQIFYSERPKPVRLNVEISYHFRRFLAGSLD